MINHRLFLHGQNKYGNQVRGVAQPGSVSVWGAGGRKFKSCHPDERRNQKTSKACKSNDLQAFLFLRCQNKLFKTVVNVNKTVKHINNLNINRLQT